MNEEGVGNLLPLHVTPSASRHGGEGVAILLPLTALVPRHGAPGSAVRREGVIILFPLPLRCQAMCHLHDKSGRTEEPNKKCAIRNTVSNINQVLATLISG